MVALLESRRTIIVPSPPASPKSTASRSSMSRDVSVCLESCRAVVPEVDELDHESENLDHPCGAMLTRFFKELNSSEGSFNMFPTDVDMSSSAASPAVENRFQRFENRNLVDHTSTGYWSAEAPAAETHWKRAQRSTLRDPLGTISDNSILISDSPRSVKLTLSRDITPTTPSGRNATTDGMNTWPRIHRRYPKLPPHIPDDTTTSKTAADGNISVQRQRNITSDGPGKFREEKLLDHLQTLEPALDTFAGLNSFRRRPQNGKGSSPATSKSTSPLRHEIKFDEKKRRADRVKARRDYARYRPKKRSVRGHTVNTMNLSGDDSDNSLADFCYSRDQRHTNDRISQPSHDRDRPKLEGSERLQRTQNLQGHGIELRHMIAEVDRMQPDDVGYHRPDLKAATTEIFGLPGTQSAHVLRFGKRRCRVRPTPAPHSMLDIGRKETLESIKPQTLSDQLKRLKPYEEEEGSDRLCVSEFGDGLNLQQDSSLLHEHATTDNSKYTADFGHSQAQLLPSLEADCKARFASIARVAGDAPEDLEIKSGEGLIGYHQEWVNREGWLAEGTGAIADSFWGSSNVSSDLADSLERPARGFSRERSISVDALRKPEYHESCSKSGMVVGIGQSFQDPLLSSVQVYWKSEKECNTKPINPRTLSKNTTDAVVFEKALPGYSHPVSQVDLPPDNGDSELKIDQHEKVRYVQRPNPPYNKKIQIFSNLHHTVVLENWIQTEINEETHFDPIHFEWPSQSLAVISAGKPLTDSIVPFQFSYETALLHLCFTTVLENWIEGMNAEEICNDLSNLSHVTVLENWIENEINEGTNFDPISFEWPSQSFGVISAGKPLTDYTVPFQFSCETNVRHLCFITTLENWMKYGVADETYDDNKAFSDNRHMQSCYQQYQDVVTGKPLSDQFYFSSSNDCLALTGRDTQQSEFSGMERSKRRFNLVDAWTDIFPAFDRIEDRRRLDYCQPQPYDPPKEPCLLIANNFKSRDHDADQSDFFRHCGANRDASRMPTRDFWGLPEITCRRTSASSLRNPLGYDPPQISVRNATARHEGPGLESSPGMLEQTDMGHKEACMISEVGSVLAGTYIEDNSPAPTTAIDLELSFSERLTIAMKVDLKVPAVFRDMAHMFSARGDRAVEVQRFDFSLFNVDNSILASDCSQSPAASSSRDRSDFGYVAGHSVPYAEMHRTDYCSVPATIPAKQKSNSDSPMSALELPWAEVVRHDALPAKNKTTALFGISIAAEDGSLPTAERTRIVPVELKKVGGSCRVKKVDFGEVVRYTPSIDESISNKSIRPSSPCWDYRDCEKEFGPALPTDGSRSLTKSLRNKIRKEVKTVFGSLGRGSGRRLREKPSSERGLGALFDGLGRRASGGKARKKVSSEQMRIVE